MSSSCRNWSGIFTANRFASSAKFKLWDIMIWHRQVLVVAHFLLAISLIFYMGERLSPIFTSVPNTSKTMTEGSIWPAFINDSIF